MTGGPASTVAAVLARIQMEAPVCGQYDRGIDIHLSPDEVAALADPAAVRAALCEACRRCRSCGCADLDACPTLDLAGACHWATPDLCSACAGRPGNRAQREHRG